MKFKINDNSVMGIIYTIVLAAIIAVFVGITVNTFYPAPKTPEALEDIGIQKEPTAEEEATTQKAQKEYMANQANWAEVASPIVLVVATLTVLLGLYLAGKMTILPNGVLLGGLFTIFYAIGLGFMSQSRYLTFGVATASLILIAGAGYWRFARVSEAKK